MNKHNTGSYLIYLYDKYGTKQETLSAASLTEAQTLGDRGISQPPYASYTVVRVIINTLDKAYPWSIQNGQLQEIDIETQVPSAETPEQPISE